MNDALDSILDILGFNSENILATSLGTGLITFFLLSDSDNPGIFIDTGSGFSWTKRIDFPPNYTGDGKIEGRPYRDLKVEGASVNLRYLGTGALQLNVGVALDESGITSADITLTGEAGGAGSLQLIYTGDLRFANPEKDSLGNIIGFTIPDPPETIQIPIPAIGLGLEFRFTKERVFYQENDPVDDSGRSAHSSVELGLPNLSSKLNLIGPLISENGSLTLEPESVVMPFFFEFELKKVLVFGDENGFGLYIGKVAVDLSEEGGPSGMPLMPAKEMGFYCEDLIAIFAPKLETNSVALGVNKLFIGTDDRVTFKANISVHDTNPKSAVESLSIAGEVRKSAIRLFKVSAILRLQPLLGWDEEPPVPTLPDQYLGVDQTKLESMLQAPENNDTFDTLHVSGEYFTHDNDIMGFEIQTERLNQSGEPVPFLFLSGELNNLLLSFGAIAGGIFFISEEKPGLGGTLITLGMLSTLHQFLTGPQNTNFKLGISGLGYRYISVGNDRVRHEILAKGVGYYPFPGDILAQLPILFEFLSGVTNVGFGFNLGSLRIDGKLGLKIDLNEAWGDPLTPDEETRLYKVIKKQNTEIRPTDLPRFYAETNDDSIVRIDRVELVMTDGRYGIAIYVGGVGYGDFALGTDLGGIVITFWPELTIEYLHPKLKLSRIKITYPKIVLVDFILDQAKPLPGGGQETAIAARLGFIHKNGAPDALTNYSYQLGATFVQGRTNIPNGDPYSYWFASINYASKSGIPITGAVKLYGISGLCGSNVAPAFTGNAGDAQALGNWLFPNLGQGVDNMTRWAEPGSQNGWGPKPDSWAFGASATLGDPINLCTIQGVLLFGGKTREDFYLAIAGVGKIEKLPVDFGVILVVADCESFQFKGIARWRPGGGILLELSGSLEIDYDGSWKFFFGHYDDSLGSPLYAKLFNGLFELRLYFVFDSLELKNFGLVVDREQTRPTLSGSAVGLGGLFVYDDKYGWKWLNLRIFAGVGFNVGFSGKPTLFFGNFFIGGRVEVRVCGIGFGLGLLASMESLADKSGAYIMTGVFRIKLNLPWPLPDYSFSIDFTLKDGTPAISTPVLESRVTGLYGLENRSIQAVENQPPVLPIDGIPVLGFNKGLNSTRLGEDHLLNDGDRGMAQPREVIRTNFDSGGEYEISYDYYLESLSIVPDGGSSLSPLVSAWAASDQRNEYNSDPAQRHRALLLNSWDPTGELNVYPEAAERIIDSLKAMNTPACGQQTVYCVIHGEKTGKIQGEDRYFIRYDTDYGDIIIRESRYHQSPYGWLREKRLSWFHNTTLMLPYRTELVFPSCTKVVMQLGFRMTDEVPASLQIEVYLQEDATPVILELSLNAGVDPADLTGETGTLFWSLTETGRNYNSSETMFELTLETRGDSLINMLELEAIRYGIEGQFEYGVPLAGFEALGGYSYAVLQSLCVTFGQYQRESWSDVLEESFSNRGQEVTPDSYLDFLLFQPNTLHQINYNVNWEGAVSSSEDSELSGKKDGMLSGTQGFITEEFPSQDVKAYVQFSYPLQESFLPYPEHIIPVIGLKRRGLILKIYEKHFGENALEVTVLQNGNPPIPLGFEHTLYMDISGEPADSLLEQTLASCAPDIQGLTFTAVHAMQEVLDVNKDYSIILRLTEEISFPEEFNFAVENKSFKTSRYPNFSEHITVVNTALSEGRDIHDPLLVDQIAAFEAIEEELESVLNGEGAGENELIEAIMNRVLGKPAGWLDGAPQGNQSRLILSEDPSEARPLAIVLELEEGFIQKPGFSLTNGVRLASGLLRTEDHLILHDLDGQRFIFIYQPDGGLPGPFPGAFEFTVEFDPMAYVPEDSDRAIVREAIGLMNLPDEGHRVSKVSKDILVTP